MDELPVGPELRRQELERDARADAHRLDADGAVGGELRRRAAERPPALAPRAPDGCDEDLIV